ncbi:TerD family protein [Streptomyces sp. NPDC049040]|uniref:TerD family protein n=1 Tax=Streptomyces sp. NPDC049040 TaxID=3365593 RepID=UPI0037195542
MTLLSKGANAPVPDAALRIAVCRRQVTGAPAVDASALLLDAVGKVRGDADLVFYNQSVHPSGAIRHSGTAEGGGVLADWLEVDLPRVEPGIQRVLIAASCDGGVFGHVPGLYVQALTADGTVVAHYAVTDASSETAFVLGEFYRRNGQWKFRAIGQGYASGLAGLATDFGITVEEPAAAGAPVAAQDAVPSSLGAEFQPYVQRGRGNGVVSAEVPLPPGPAIVEAWHEGDGYFSAHTLDGRNKEDGLLFNTTKRDFRGRALVRVPEGRPLRLRIAGDNDWTVLVQPLSVARTLGTAPLRGHGPEVVAYLGTAADLDVEYAGDDDGSGYFGMTSHEAALLDDPNAYDLLVNDTGRLRQTAPLPDGPLLLVLEAEGAWQLSARPLPVHDQAAAQAAGVWTGRGAKTVTLVNPSPGRPALLEYEITGEDGIFGHRVTLVDEYDDEEPYLDGTHHGERGRALLFRHGEGEARLRLENAGVWKLRLLPIEQAPALTGPAEGAGSTVLRYDGPPALLGLQRTTDDDGSLLTRAFQAGGRSAVSADTTGKRRPVTGPLWVSGAGYCYVQVFATDSTGWRIEPADLASAPVLGKRAEGHGYGVVRNTGPDTEVMVTYAPRGMLDLPVLWELDEHLEPVRRISTSAGLQRLPSGIFQFRGRGRWTLEPRG